MTEAVFDFKAIGAKANLKALDGRVQDVVAAGIGPKCTKHDLPSCSVCRIEAEPTEVDWTGDFSAMAEPAEGWHVYWQANLYGDLKPNQRWTWSDESMSWVQS